MKRLVSFRSAEGWWRAGVEIDGVVVDLAQAGWRFDEQPTSVRSVLARGPEAVDAAIERAATALERGTVAGSAIASHVLGPPVPNPDKILCLGVNYRAHIDEAKLAVPPIPVVFAKLPNTLIGAGTPIPITPDTEQVDYEGELAAVIGRRCKSVRANDALAHVAGYAPFNDVCDREVQLRVSQWTIGKSIDGFGPMGPGLVPASAVPDPQNLELTTRVNGEIVQQANTSQMVVSLAEAIAYISTYITLEPGDIVATGTAGGVGLYREPQLFLRDGDVVEVKIERLGILRNPVKAQYDAGPAQTEAADSGATPTR